MPQPNDEDLLEHFGEFLAHYASQYYDPEKRRQYYLRTRELKGKQPTSDMSDEQKEVWQVTRGNMSEARKKELESEKSTTDKTLENLRAKAAEAQAKLEEKLRNRLAELQEAIPIPPNATPRRRALLEAQRRKQVAFAIDTVRTAMRKVAEELRGDLKNTRTKSVETRQKIDEKFETESQSEYEKIRSQVK
jgi:multidrug efflux pump subunit AcrA (membrane-fusion protein)